MLKITLPKILIGFYCLTLLILAFTTNGTADSGDSVFHFLYAKYAPLHPDNFFNAWAKPLFTLLACPFTLLDFTGIKLFNILITVISISAAYLTAHRLKMVNSWVVIVFMMIAPMNLPLALSGLTEPLFGCLLISGICLLVYEKSAAAALILSFLPFVRSEGMFLLVPFAIYYIAIGKYKQILLLFTGQILYGLLGYFFSDSFFWFYESNPYSFISKYGHGDWKWYIKEIPFIYSLPAAFFLVVGIVWFFITLFIKREKSTGLMLLIIAVAIFYFLFHEIAWTYGLFGSFGMLRIIMAIAPLVAIICLAGYNAVCWFFYLSVNVKRNFYNKTGMADNVPVANFSPAVLNIILVLLMVAINIREIKRQWNDYRWETSFSITLTPDEVIDNEMATYMVQKHPDFKTSYLCYNAVYLAMALDVDPFSYKHLWGLNNKGTVPASGYYIWDEWFSVMEGGVHLEQLVKDNNLIRDTSFTAPGHNGPRMVVLFRKKN